MDLSAEPTPAQPSSKRTSAVRLWLEESACFKWPEVAALSIFAALVAFAIPFHEPWSDEAQAWQLARSLSLGDLFHTYIRYEASPGLWHLLLWVLNRLHVTYAGIHWVCGAAAVAAAGLLIFESPLPRYLRLTLPFTYFLLFQYAVIARSYALVPLLLFLVAILWRKRPVSLALALGLLANLSLHAAAVSGGLALAYFAQRHRGRIDRRWRTGADLVSTILLASLYAFALWTAWPPPDLRLSAFRYDSRPFASSALASLTLGICEPWVLSIFFWIAVAIWLRARRSLVLLLPVVFFTAFSGLVYAQFWHMGLLAPLVIALVWIAWPDAAGSSNWGENAGRAALVVMAAIQIAWSAYALAWDHGHEFSGDRAAAQFLQAPVRNGSRILLTWEDEPNAKGFDGVGVLPYFDHNIFENLPKPFWWWSEKSPIEQRFNELLPTRPQIVIVEGRLRSPNESFDMKTPVFQRLLRAGYRFTNQFCGTVPMRLELGLTSCHLIFQRQDQAQGMVPGSRPAR